MKHFDKNMPEHLISIPQKGKAPFFAIDSAEGLNVLIQYGTLEIHPWNCTTGRGHRTGGSNRHGLRSRPDGGFRDGQGGAFEVRELLKDLGLESWVKVTGGKGVHVQFPFNPRYDWDAVKEFAKTIALEMARAAPGFVHRQHRQEGAREQNLFGLPAQTAAGRPRSRPTPCAPAPPAPWPCRCRGRS